MKAKLLFGMSSMKLQEFLVLGPGESHLKVPGLPLQADTAHHACDFHLAVIILSLFDYQDLSLSDFPGVELVKRDNLPFLPECHHFVPLLSCCRPPSYQRCWSPQPPPRRDPCGPSRSRLCFSFCLRRHLYP